MINYRRMRQQIINFAPKQKAFNNAMFGQIIMSLALLPNGSRNYLLYNGSKQLTHKLICNVSKAIYQNLSKQQRWIPVFNLSASDKTLTQDVYHSTSRSKAFIIIDIALLTPEETDNVLQAIDDPYLNSKTDPIFILNDLTATSSSNIQRKYGQFILNRCHKPIRLVK